MRWRTPVFGLIAVAALVGGIGGALSSQPAGNPGASWDKYRVLTSRNIFVRDRSRPQAPQPRFDSRPVIERREEPSLVVTGIGQSGPVWVAFLEDPRTGKTIQVAAGETVDNKRVVDVALDGIEYESRGARKRIAIGQDLGGAAASLSASGAATKPAPTTQGAPTTQAATDSSSEDAPS
jgi:hypothetical protein